MVEATACHGDGRGVEEVARRRPSCPGRGVGSGLFGVWVIGQPRWNSPMGRPVPRRWLVSLMVTIERSPLDAAATRLIEV
jgi:hypothetical protein